MRHCTCARCGDSRAVMKENSVRKTAALHGRSQKIFDDRKVARRQRGTCVPHPAISSSPFLLSGHALDAVRALISARV
jgi:hypothetical protein